MDRGRWAVALGVVLGLVFPPHSPQAQTPRRPAVYLNHVVIVVDSAIYEAIGQSAVLREELAGFEQRTTTADGGMTWSGTYLFGRSTYLELFAPGGVAGPAGFGMIGFGVEEPGGLALVRRRLAEATGLEVDWLLRMRARGTEQVPWFHAVAARGVMTASRFPTWVMEYHAEYMQRWFADLPRERNGILRWQPLAGAYRPERLLREIVGITAALAPADWDRLRKEATGFGYEVSGDGFSGRLRGPDLELVVVPATADRSGVIELRLALSLPKAGERVFRFGPRSVLSFGADATATWTF